MKKKSVSDLHILKEMAIAEYDILLEEYDGSDSYKEKRKLKPRLTDMGNIISKLELELKDRLYKLL